MATYPDPIVLRTNADWRDVLTIKTGSVAVEIAPGTPFRMHIRTEAISPYIEFLLSTANGKLVITEDGKLAINVEDTEIAAALGPRDGAETAEYVCDLVMVEDGIDRVVMIRGIVVEQGVTRK